MPSYTYEDLLKIISDLRGENGCPWDRVQTHDSLKPCLIEECYEVIEAIDRRDDDNLAEELGDVLLQVLMHSQIAAEENRFDMQDVVQGLSEKMIRRHPHVFGDAEAGTPEEGLRNWEDIKKQEKEAKTETPDKGILRSVPKAFPALTRAQKVQKKAEKEYGYTRSAKEQITILKDRLEQIEQAYNSTADRENGTLATEIETFLFETADLSGILGLNAEISLTNATETFINKFEDEMDKQK